MEFDREHIKAITKYWRFVLYFLCKTLIDKITFKLNFHSSKDHTLHCCNLDKSSKVFVIQSIYSMYPI